MKRHKYPMLAGFLVLAACLSGCGSNGLEQESEEIQGIVSENAEAFAEENDREESGTNVAEETIQTESGPEAEVMEMMESLEEAGQENQEAYAWIEITDTDMSYPILQASQDEYYYLSHNIYGEEDDNGCIYTEYYNNKDFNDPNTIIYGRNKEAMFGKLHQYQDRDFFDAHREIRIYTEGKTLTYQIFAAYTYDDRHLLATYDFWDKDIFSRYLYDVSQIRAMDAYYDEAVEVTAEDKIITLSTGVTGEDDKRYLVQAVLISG